MYEAKKDMPETQNNRARHPLRVAVSRSGLQPYVIRAWADRYRAIEARDLNGEERLFSDQDIEKLSLLRRATEAGMSISKVATLGTEELSRLVADAEKSANEVPALAPASEGRQKAIGDANTAVRSCLDAVQRLDSLAVHSLLERASEELGEQAVLIEVLAPLLHEIGRLWEKGRLRPVHEHMASAALRFFLGARIAQKEIGPKAPEVVVATPAGQRLEIGALLAAALAAGEGWRVTYLGPDLPAEEIAMASRQREARALALSLQFPKEDALVAEEILKIRQLAGPEVVILAGGLAAASYEAEWRQIGAHRLEDLRALPAMLESMSLAPSRKGRAPAPKLPTEAAHQASPEPVRLAGS